MLFRDAGHVTTKHFEQPKCTLWSAVTGRQRLDFLAVTETVLRNF
jgi:hypothetical protein